HARRAHRRSVDQRVTAGADYRAHGRRADSLTQTQRLESGGEHFGVRRRAPILEHHLRSEVTGEGTARSFDAARLPHLIITLDENCQQLLFDVAAAVPTLIDDQRFLVAEFTNFFLEL